MQLILWDTLLETKEKYFLDRVSLASQITVGPSQVLVEGICALPKTVQKWTFFPQIYLLFGRNCTLLSKLIAAKT